MSEYELSDLVATYASNLMEGQTLFITIFSAYMLVAYTVGKQLGRFQVSFITFAFLLFSSSMTLGGVQALELVMGYSDELYVINNEDVEDVRRGFTVGLFYIVRAVLVIGALAFMWQVRHPKTE
mgnify:FL=1